MQPLATLRRACQITLDNRLRFAYTGNVHDTEGDMTYYHACRRMLIDPDWYRLLDCHLEQTGRRRNCGTPCAGGRSDSGYWGAHRQPVRIALT